MFDGFQIKMQKSILDFKLHIFAEIEEQVCVFFVCCEPKLLFEKLCSYCGNSAVKLAKMHKTQFF
jgi:hypothetical protein